MRRMLIGVALLLLGAAGACNSTATTPTGVTTAPTGDPSGTPTPSPTARTKAEDAADLKRALVTADDLGKRWVKPKSVSRVVGKKGEMCPGHASAMWKVKFTANASTDLTEDTGTGTRIASYRLQTAPDEDVSGLVTAIKTDQKACARYRDASGFSVVRSVGGPTTVAGAEVVAGWAERVYYVKPRKLAYARHYLVVRQGRVVSMVSYAFLASKKDPDAKDFGEASRLLQVQLDKNAGVFT